MRSMLRILAVMTLVALAAACTGGGAPAASPVASTPVAAATVAPTAAPTDTPVSMPDPTPTPWPATDGEGDEVVRGVEQLGVLSTPYTITKVGDVNQYRGGVVSFADEMNDPRVSGTVTFKFGVDAYTVAGSEWGDITVKNDKGAWTGTCTGGLWAAGEGIAWSCWLAGSGDYAGYTYYKQVRMDTDDTVAEVIGVVYPGEPPKP